MAIADECANSQWLNTKSEEGMTLVALILVVKVKEMKEVEETEGVRIQAEICPAAGKGAEGIVGEVSVTISV